MQRSPQHPVTSGELSQLVVGWLARYASTWTRSRYRRDLGAFAAFLHPRGRNVLQATPDDVRAWARELAGSRADLDGTTCPLRATNTVAVKCTAVSSFFRYCIAAGAAQVNPVEQARSDAAGTWTNRTHHDGPTLGLGDVRAVLTAAHRDPYLGGTLGVTLVGLITATQWRPERVTALTVSNALDRLDETVLPKLPRDVQDYLDAWLLERPATSQPGLFRDRSGQRRITTVDVLRLVQRSGVRAGLGEDITAPRLARSVDVLARRGILVLYPTLDELRSRYPAPEQLALPDSPDGYDQTEAPGQAALMPLPDNIVYMPRKRRRPRRRAG